MKLTDFCTNITTHDFASTSVVLLKSKQYSPLFFNRFIKFLQKKFGVEVKKIDVDQNFDDTLRQLQTTFLGQTCVYWFSDISNISSKKKRADWLSYIATYQGPHQIIGSILDDQDLTLSHGIIIELQDSYTSDQIIKLSMLYDHDKPEITAYFIGKLYRYRKEYTIEQLCVLLEYAAVLGKNTDLFFEQWIDQLVVSDVSLYYVSQLFFEKNSSDFFDTWSKIRPVYSDQFWTAFFSEQLFKAYWYVTWQARVAPEHKAITYGLPFSFLKQDWKLYQAITLQQAHQKIYEVDLLLKSGGNPSRLDLFIIQFFKGF